MKKNITITWANEKGGVGKTTLCTLFANYLSEKKMSDVCVLDCDRQHSIVDKRKFDSQSLQTDKVPYEVKQIEIMGGLTEVSVDVRIVMREAVLNNATIMAICHNHPSGSLHPSKYDDMLTQSVKKACEVMRIHLADHVIVTDGCYYSYSEQGKI